MMKVMIVDDNEESRYLLESLLKADGYQAESSANGAEAIKRLKTSRYDLIISDILMPEMDGFHLCRKVKTDQAMCHIPFIIYTATYTGPQDEAFAAKMGADRFIQKPCEPDIFMVAVKEVMAAANRRDIVTVPAKTGENEILRLYNERLIRNLEQKMLNLEKEIQTRKRAEIALRESEERYRNILENVIVGVFQVTIDGGFVFANKKMTEMFGFSSYEELQAIGSIAKLYVRPEERHQIFNEIENKGFLIREIESKKKDGTSIWVRLHARKTTTKEGLTIIEGLMEDVTEIRKLEAQLQQAQRLEAIGTLAGGIAHDFNNILSSVIGFAELSLNDARQETLLYDNLTEVILAGNRARDLVKQIMTFSKKGELEKKPIAFNPLITDTVKMLRSMIPKHIDIKEHIINENLTINANPSQMNQVIVNLVTNASHAVDENGIIEIGLKEIAFEDSIQNQYPDLLTGKYAELIVRDNGCGIAKEHLNLIFDPYFTTKDKEKGTGLGLAVVHGIVKMHGGHITVHSEIGRGTTFHVYLPLSERPYKIKTPLQSKPLTGGTESILFVDDELPIVKMQKQILQRMGYTVTAKNSSQEALEAFRSSPGAYDLVITDMSMPYLTGDKLAQAVKDLRPDIPVILCTGFSQKLSEKTAADLVVDGYLMKPVGKEEMAQTIRTILEKAKMSG